MSNHTDEKILDSCLEELLGGCRPPNLTPRILREYGRLQQELGHTHGRTSNALAETQQVETEGAAVTVRPVPARQHVTTSSSWVGVAVAVGVVVAGTSLGLLALRLSPPGKDPVRATAALAPAAPPAGANSSSPVGPQQVAEDGTIDTRPPLAVPEFGERLPFESIVGKSSQEAIVVAPLEAQRIVATVDELIRRGWREADLLPAAALSDQRWCDRVFQRLIGRSPTAAEVAAFETAAANVRRAELIESLCEGAEYEQEFARHWGGLWAGDLVPGASEAAAEHRQHLGQFLQSSFLADRNLAEITEALLTADGDAVSSEGAVNYLLAHFGPKSLQMAGHTSRIFMGQRFECAQCHDHPADPRIAQRTYWEWNAFFRLLKVDRASGAMQLSEKASGNAATKPIFFDVPDGELRAAYPTFPGSSTSQLLVTAGAARRDELAARLVGSSPFRTAMANRIWSMLFGYGFTFPVDDIGPHNQPSHPEVLALIAEQLAAHQFHLKDAVRWIVSSEAFGLEGTRSDQLLADRPEWGKPALFSRFYESPDVQPVDALLVALQADRSLAPDAPTTARIAPRTPPTSSEPLAAATSVAARATLRMARTLHRGPPAAVATIINSDMDRDGKMSHLFHALLGRAPRRVERQSIAELLDKGPETEAEKWLDIWWALTQSDEYLP